MRLTGLWRRRSKKARRGGIAYRAAALGLRLIFAVTVLTILLVIPWRWLPPPTSAFMLRERWGGKDEVEYRWVPMRAISRNLAIAAVAAEDQKFPNHHGFDLAGIAEALERNRSDAGSLRGGSTITQQVAKNLFLWPAQSVIRKGAEAWLTLWLEVLWPKRRILEIYLNIAEFGPGTYGADAAAHRAFGKPPSDLTLPEAARLVAVLPSPRRMSIVDPSDYVEERTREIVEAVGDLGGVRYLDGL